MEEKGVLKSCHIVSKPRDDDSLCAIYFGISCAFFAFKYLSKQELDDQKSLNTRDKMLQGSAHLLGLLVWRVQKHELKSTEKCDCELLNQLSSAQREISELKRIRSEDAKANEKVACIYAAQEQSWFAERRKLQHQIGVLMNDLRVLERRKNESVSELNCKIQEIELMIKSKEKMLEEEEKRRKEMEEKVKSVEIELNELKENHSSELLKHKTAFIELISNQRQLEAELGRAVRQAEGAKKQLEFVYEEKEEAMLIIQQLSMEIEKMRKDSDQKNKVLAAVMRKSRLEIDEKLLLKPRRKRDEMEVERWMKVSGLRIERRTLRNMLSRQVSARLESERRGDLDQNGDVFDELEKADEVRKECDEDYSLHLEQSLHEESPEFDEVKRLDEWVQSEAEKYHDAVQHQMRMEDKLEAYRWRLRNTEVESKRLQSQIEGLNQDMSQLRCDNLKLESLLLDREVELKTLKDQISLQLNCLSAQKAKLHSSRHELNHSDDSSWSKIKFIKKRSAEKEGTETLSKETSSSTNLSSTKDIEEEEEEEEEVLSSSVEVNGNEAMAKLCLNRSDKKQGKLDLHALGVSYKIKRLNQQLLMLERLTTKHESGEIKGDDEHGEMRMKGFVMLLSLLNKQVSRYQSLQEKTDDLSKRMGEKDLRVVKQGGSRSTRTKAETKSLEHYLEETFQLQRFIVATGQKLVEIQSKIASGFEEICKELNGNASFDMKRFADSIQSLFKDVQRGIEVRIARIIGDLEGTLACDGIHSLKC